MKLLGASKSVRVEDKDTEQRRDIDSAKEKDRFKEKYWVKSIQELDLSDCERCTPSYRLLPKDVRVKLSFCACVETIVNLLITLTLELFSL